MSATPATNVVDFSAYRESRKPVSAYAGQAWVPVMWVMVFVAPVVPVQPYQMAIAASR